MKGRASNVRPFLLTLDGPHWIIVIEMIVPPDLNQARVNKCLIMLVSRKFVTKDNSTVSARSIG